MKRLFFTIVVIVTISISAQAKAAYSGGSGTADDPYQIATVDDLMALRSNTSDYDANFIVTADIDMSSWTFYNATIARDTDNTTAGFQGVAFSGVFDGNGHTINNLKIDTGGVGNDYLGLFGYVDGGTIRNLVLLNLSVTGGSNSENVGGLAGYHEDGIIYECHSAGDVTGTMNVGGFAGTNTGTIYDCSFVGSVAGQKNIGGIAGYNDDGVISECSSTGNITGGYDATSIGGLVGENTGNIGNCISTGDVTGGESSIWLGGLAGHNRDGIIFKSCSTSDISVAAISSSIGGLIGGNYNSNINNCYATGAVTGGNYYSGGLIGYNSGGSTTNCYSAGVVTGTNNLGGLVGYNLTSVVSSFSNCFFLNTSGPDNGIGAPRTDAQMKQQAVFVGWDFVDVWQISEGISYPKLAWQITIQPIKCSVSAGSKENSDKFSISGTLETTDEFIYAPDNVTVTLNSADMIKACIQTFPASEKTWKNGKFSYSGTTSDGVKKSFKYDSKSGKFSFSASKLDLLGLSCPLTVQIKTDACFGTTEVNETTANGKKPIPIVLMMGVKNSLRVDSIKVKQSTNPRSDQLTVQGGFAVEDRSVDMASWNLDITLNKEPYTIEAGKIIRKKNGYGCSNVVLWDTYSIGTVDFNFKTGRFKATIKKTDIDDLPGTIDFGIMFGDYEENVDVDLL